MKGLLADLYGVSAPVLADRVFPELGFGKTNARCFCCLS